MGKSPVRFTDLDIEKSAQSLSPVKLAMTVHYTDGYPDELPELSLQLIDGEVDEDDIRALLASAQVVVSVLAHSHILCFTSMWINRARRT